MPKVRIPKKNVTIDMTALTDVSFLLLTFFILTAQFRPAEVVAVDTPSSRSNEEIKEDNITLTVDSAGHVYMNLYFTRRIPTLDSMIERYGDKFPVLKTLTPAQIDNFANVETFGFDINQLPSLLNNSVDALKSLKSDQMSGIPSDTANNQLGYWVNAARSTGLSTGTEIPLAIKGDKKTNVVAVKDVIETLRSREIYRFNLITTLESNID